MNLEADGSRRENALLAVADLAFFDAARWQGWLRLGSLIWTRAPTDAERVLAFRPLVLDPREEDEQHLAHKLDSLPPQSREALDSGLAAALERWSIEDGIASGAFLLRFAAWFGCNLLNEAIHAFLAKVPPLPHETRQELAGALAFVACRRLTQEDAGVLLRRMREIGIETRRSSIRLLARYASKDPLGIRTDLRAIFPALQSGKLANCRKDLHSSDARYLADQIVHELGVEHATRVAFCSDHVEILFLRLCIEEHRLRFPDFFMSQVHDAPLYVYDQLRREAIPIVWRPKGPDMEIVDADLSLRFAMADSAFASGRLGEFSANA